MTTRDPLAVMDAYGLHIRLRLPRLFGQRSCNRCPRCNAHGEKHPCQNRFGSNMRATGGILGGSPANGSATEHQGIGTPHVHGEIHIASVYQYKLLPEIAKLIEDDVLDPQSIMDFNAWYHMEEPPNQQLHDEMVEGIEKEWHARFSDRKHDDMSQVPAYIANDHAANMWSDKSVSKEKAQAEGVVFKKQYFEDA